MARRTARKSPPTASEVLVGPQEFAERRSAALRSLKDHVGLVLAGDADPSLHGAWQPHQHFAYLTGITDEPGAMLLLDPTNPSDARKAILLLRPLNPELERWDGFRAAIASPLQERYGIKTILRTNMLSRLLLEAARRSRKLACMMPLSPYNAPRSQDLDIMRQQSDRIPGCVLSDRSSILVDMRSAKSKSEIECIRRAGQVTAHGFDAALRTIRPGITEFDVQESMEHAYRTNGARATAYRTIAGSGFNGTVLHYHANDQPLNAGDLIVLDSGAALHGYASDVTRTYPVSGTFTPRQRELYSVVLKALEAGIRACRAGTTIAKIDAAARKVIVDAGYGDAFIHGTSHHLGLEVHDPMPDGVLREGSVITVEPGIYLPSESVGIRIEDDVVCTKNGPINLTGSIPKTIAEIESRMSTRR
ncbi:MAG: Xaa-Pro peptidase family protein [Planctomycetota bacterium]|nr:Xaa-Pro peptidase family protein [Planctomycetota bacterium]